MAASSIKITKQAVDKAAPGASRYILWDTELKGFGVRIAESGTKTYVVRYRPRNLGAGSPKRFVVLGRHGVIAPDQARSKAKEILGAVAGGEDPAKLRTAPPSVAVADLAESFLREHAHAKRKPKTAESYAALLNKYLIPRFAERPAPGITASDLSDMHFALRDRPYQANRLVAVVASMYAFAERRGDIAKGANPAKGIERFPERSRDRFLGTEELRRLGETLRLAETSGLPWRSPDKPDSKHLANEANRRTKLQPEVVLAFRLLIATGARVGEILSLEWRYVDIERGLLFLPDSKTGRKTIVMSASATELLRTCPRNGSYVIFGARGDQPRVDLKKPWSAIQRHAGLEGVRIHDLRHTFASVGAGASLGLPIVGKLLGHSQPATAARYAHLDADPLRRAANIIGEHLNSAMADIPSPPVGKL